MGRTWTEHDRFFMERALLVAERGRGQVSPNPLVGCVVVKDNVIISEGWHYKAGERHAEAQAINGLKDKKLLALIKFKLLLMWNAYMTFKLPF